MKQVVLRRLQKLVRDYLRDQRMTQSTFAELAGMSQSGLSRFLNESRGATSETVRRLARAMDLDWTTLYELVEEVPPSRKLRGDQMLKWLYELPPEYFDLFEAQIRAAIELRRAGAHSDTTGSDGAETE